MARLENARDKLTGAVDCLIGAGTIKERLSVAWFGELHLLNPVDYPPWCSSLQRSGPL
jgi:hypothetical protein